MKEKTLYYIPSPEEREKIDACMGAVITVLKPLNIEQKALALLILVQEFERLSGCVLVEKYAAKEVVANGG